MASHKSTELPVIRKSDDIFTTFNQIQNMIREHAFHLFNDRNPNEGDAMSDWLNAESGVLTDINLTFEDDEDQVMVEGSITGFLPEEIEIKAKDGIFEIGGIHTEKSSSRKKERPRLHRNR